VLKVVIALVLLGHRIGHSLGILQVTNVAVVNADWHGDSWLLSAPLGTTAAQAIGVALWAGSMVGFAAA
jgi:hypothetical protein